MIWGGGLNFPVNQEDGQICNREWGESSARACAICLEGLVVPRVIQQIHGGSVVVFLARADPKSLNLRRVGRVRVNTQHPPALFASYAL